MNRELTGSKITNKFSAPDYLAFVREFRCLISNEECSGATEAHHATYKSHEGSDLSALPLCAGMHHPEFHKLGTLGFAQRYNINPVAICQVLLHLYFREQHWGSRPAVKPEARKLARGKNLKPTTKTVNKF